MTTLSERLQLAMAGPPEIKAADLARAVGVRAPSVVDWQTGRTKRLEGSNLLAASEFLKVNPWWLATGKGAMRAPYHLVPTDASPAPASLPSEAWPFTGTYSDYCKLPELDRSALDMTVTSFIEARLQYITSDSTTTVIEGKTDRIRSRRAAAGR
jgi:hypothetical protein